MLTYSPPLDQSDCLNSHGLCSNLQLHLPTYCSNREGDKNEDSFPASSKARPFSRG